MEAEACGEVSGCKRGTRGEKHTLWLDSSTFSERASLAAAARVPMLALESFATSLLASLEAPERPCRTVSET